MLRKVLGTLFIAGFTAASALAAAAPLVDA